MKTVFFYFFRNCSRRIDEFRIEIGAHIDDEFKITMQAEQKTQPQPKTALKEGLYYDKKHKGNFQLHVILSFGNSSNFRNCRNLSDYEFKSKIIA